MISDNLKANLVVPLLCVIFVLFVRNGNYYYAEVLSGSIVLGILYSYIIGIRIHASVGIFASIAIITSLVHTLPHPNGYDIAYGIDTSIFTTALMNQGMVWGFLFLGVLAFSGRELFKALVRSIPWLLVINTILILTDFFWPPLGGLKPDGIIGNSSIDPGFVGPAIPLVYYFPPKLRNNPAFIIPIVISAIVAIFYCKGSVGIGSMAVSIGSLFLLGENLNLKKTFFYGALVFSLVLLVAYCFLGAELFSDSNRIRIYTYSLNWWKDHANIWFGTGLGSYWAFGPYAQKLANQRIGTEVFTWMHSDWLQVLFELGIAGLLSVLSVAFFLVKNCLRLKRYHVLSAALAYGGTMCFNMPSKTFTTAFLGMIILVLGFMDEEEYNSLGFN